jgi:hypothetical protein
MTKHTPIFEELDHELKNVTLLSHALNLRQVRVTQYPPGGAPVDLTGQYEEGPTQASNALLMAVTALRNVDASS